MGPKARENDSTRVYLLPICQGLEPVPRPRGFGRGITCPPLKSASRVGREAAVSQLTRADLSPRSGPSLLEGFRTEEGGSLRCAQDDKRESEGITGEEA